MTPARQGISGKLGAVASDRGFHVSKVALLAVGFVAAVVGKWQLASDGDAAGWMFNLFIGCFAVAEVLEITERSIRRRRGATHDEVNSVEPGGGRPGWLGTLRGRPGSHPKREKGHEAWRSSRAADFEIPAEPQAAVRPAASSPDPPEVQKAEGDEAGTEQHPGGHEVGVQKDIAPPLPLLINARQLAGEEEQHRVEHPGEEREATY